MTFLEDFQNFIEEKLLESGIIEPHALIFADKGCTVINLKEVISTEKDRILVLNRIAEIVHENKAHKVLFVTEVTYYATDEKVNIDLLTINECKKQLPEQEAYQIIEITKDKITTVLRDIHRVSNTIQLGEIIPQGTIINHVYNNIQNNLTVLN